MKVFLKKFSVFLVCFVFLTALLAFGSLLALRNSNFYKPSFLANTVSQDQFDYIVLGASNGLTTLNTKVIDSSLSTNGVNLSMDDTVLSSQYLMLQHFLAEGNTTKFCVLSSSPSTFDNKINRINDNDYRFLMYGHRSYVSNYYREFPGKKAKILYASKWLPTIGVSYFNAELFFPSLLSIVKPEKRNRFDDKGNYMYPALIRSNDEINEFVNMPIYFRNQYLQKIKSLCNAHNIELICYISPMEARKAIVKSNDFKVINHSNLLTNTKYFHDLIHVNPLGREIASLEFAKTFEAFLKEN